MKVFESLPALHAEQPKKAGRQSLRSREDRQSLEERLAKDPNMIRLDKPNISASAIRKKVEAQKNEDASTVQVKKPAAPDKFDFPMDKDKDEATVAGDIKDNSPASAVTQEKLKNILSTGGFNFSDKEREVLGSILKDS